MYSYRTIITCTSFGQITYHPSWLSNSTQPSPSDSSNNHNTPTPTTTKTPQQKQSEPFPSFTQDLGMDNLRVMKVFPSNPYFFATGGDERDLHVWKVEAHEDTFKASVFWKAKNVRATTIELFLYDESVH
jgi:hypothetical protein